MFTGIVEEIGVVRGVVSGSEWGSISIGARRVLEGTRRGDSIAVNGVCLTVTALSREGFTADVMAETLRRSNLGALKAGEAVNLERAMAADGRFGGHIVSGHVDNFGEIVDTSQEGSAFWLTLSAPPDLLELVVEKGSITLDGVSLTVAARTENTFSVSLIPTTQMDTTLLRKRPGDKINLEADVIGKYVRALLHKSAPAAEPVQQPRESRLTEEFLRRNGF
ncbi:MAG: riboflavin synthase [Clostridiales bacterium]|nr:riboflavin synthase [Clostridiales bacterium]MDY4036185.1 riboflavin synthase [Candidatus Pseudoscilispira sp.]